MKKTLFDFIVDQWKTVPPVESADMTGKTVVVVGANSGIGFEAAKHFAGMNPAKLILASRNESKGIAAVSELESATGFKSCEVWKVDLADFSSAIRFADRFQRECDRLDLLVMNAGIVPQGYEETTDGWESSLQVNHLGTALCSLLLLPRLVDTGKKFGSTSRLVIVSSDVHYWVNFSEDVALSSDPLMRLNSHDYRDAESMARRYNTTKALNVFFARALQSQLGPIKVLTVNAVNPGLCYSNLRSSLRGTLVKIANAVIELCLAWTPEQGSRQLVYASIGERDNEDHMRGAYISLAEVVEPSDFVISENGWEMQYNIWKETLEILTREAPQLKSIVQEYLI